MKDLALKLENIILQDPGNRRLCDWANKGDFYNAVESLINAKHVLIATGFYIIKAKNIETDGPPGALVLAKALESIGKKVTVLVDNYALEIMIKGAKSINIDLKLKSLEPNTTPQLDSLITKDTTHFISIERPGLSADGKYYNHLGQSILPYHAILDQSFKEARLRGIKTIGIGDGGNEMGMGNLARNISQYVKAGSLIGSITPADYCICAGVSNWAGYAISALLSFYANKMLVPSKSELTVLLNTIAQEGAVDGINGSQEPTVDGLPQEWEIRVLLALREAVTSYLEVASS